jgi:hypothetical protein
MSLLNYLQFQEIDQSADDDIPEAHRSQDDIALDEPVDEDSLENFWDKVMQDIHDDSEWFSFSDE